MVPSVRMVVIDEETSGLQVGIIRQVIDRLHAHVWNVRLVQNSRPLRCGAGRDQVGDHAVQLANVTAAFAGIDDTRILGHLRPARGPEKTLPVICAVWHDRHVAIASRIGATVWGQRAVVAHGAIRRLKRAGRQMFEQQKRRHGLQHRHLNLLTLAAARLVKQRGQDCIGNRQSRGFVSHHRRRIARPVAGSCREFRQARKALDDVVVGRRLP